MTNEFEGRSRTHVDHVAVIVAAYVSKNHVAPSDLPALIAIVQTSLARLANDQSSAATELKATDAQIRKSITPDALISFIDGKPYKSLKRHLTKHGLDPQSYRRQYGLPVDYPMVAASYSERRSEISRFISLGSRQLGRASMNGAA